MRIPLREQDFRPLEWSEAEASRARAARLADARAEPRRAMGELPTRSMAVVTATVLLSCLAVLEAINLLLGLFIPGGPFATGPEAVGGFGLAVVPVYLLMAALVWHGFVAGRWGTIFLAGTVVWAMLGMIASVMLPSYLFNDLLVPFATVVHVARAVIAIVVACLLLRSTFGDWCRDYAMARFERRILTATLDG